MNPGLRKTIIAPAMAAIALMAWLLVFYTDVLVHPGRHMLTITGDGIKSYFVYAGHIQDDSTYSQFDNMNYPYGQTHIYTDGQTGIANILKWLGGFFPFFSANSIAIFNLLIMLSYPACAFFLCLIFMRFKIPPWYAAVAAFCITILSPQVFRMGGHLTLSYAVFFPFTWWLIIKSVEENKFLFSALSAINILFWFFIHPYYLMIAEVFLLAYILIWIIIYRPSYKKNRSIYLGLGVQVLLPLLLSRLYTHLVDHHADRPLIPWGFWESYANLSTIFAPSYPPFKDLFLEIFSMRHQTWEALAYVGLPAVLMALFLLFRFTRYAFRKNLKKIFQPTVPVALGISMASSILVLLYAMAYPYRWGMEFLLDWFPFLRQFRALGRFSWVFYYVFTVYAFYMLYLIIRYLRFKRLKATGWTIIVLVTAIYISESRPHHRSVASSALNSNLFNPGQLPQAASEAVAFIHKVKNDYQAIVPLPYYHIGSDNFGTNMPDESIRMSMIISYYTDLPLLASSAARTPISESKKLMQFFSPAWVEKEIRKDFPNQKPFLILRVQGDLNIRETEILSGCRKIFANNDIEIYHLDFNSVFESTANKEITTFTEKKSSLIPQEDFMLSGPGVFRYYNFDDNACDTSFHSRGAFTGRKKEFTIVFKNEALNLDTGREYVLSFWYYNKGEERNLVSCIVAETDSNNEHETWPYSFSPMHSMVIDGDWSLVEGKFKVSNSKNHTTVLFKGGDRDNQRFYADDLMIRPADTDVYKIISQDSSGKIHQLLKNNYRIRN